MMELAFSILPKDWGQYGMWSFHWIFSMVATSCVIWDIKVGPLSDCMQARTPKRGTMLYSRMQVTSAAFSEVVGKISTHPKKVFTRVRRYLCFLMGAIWVKPICQSCPGMCPLTWWVRNEGGGLIPTWGDAWLQMLHCWVMLCSVEARWRQITKGVRNFNSGLKPTCRASWNCLRICFFCLLGSNTSVLQMWAKPLPRVSD